MKDQFVKNELGDAFTGDRNYCTGIYFLMTEGNFSAFHKIKQDEMWHFYGGDALEVHWIDKVGEYHIQKIGMDIENGEIPQFVVPANCWFASKVKNGGVYSFVGCTVSPGFDFADFELAKRAELVKKYPKYVEEITGLTRI